MDLRSQILNFPNQLQVGVATVKHLPPSELTGPIIIAGMGGSELPGRILQMVRAEVILHEDYDLPQPFVSAGGGQLLKSTVICISWSGNTEETISAYQKALEYKLPITVITSGGQLAELAQQNNTPLVLLPNEGLQPRMADGFMTGALFALFGLADQLPNHLDALACENQGKQLAQQIGQKIPLIYATSAYHSLAYFWKILFNENCKIHAFTNYFPRLEHNELAGFNQRDRDKFFYLTLRDSAAESRQNRNLDTTLAILKQIGYNGSNVDLFGSTLLEKVFNNYLLGLWTSYYLALELGVDPSDIKVIEDFKSLKKS